MFIDPDGRKAARGDAQRERSFALVTVPDRQCAAGWDFFDQALGQEGADHSVGGAALEVGRKFNGAIRSRQDTHLRPGLCK